MWDGLKCLTIDSEGEILWALIWTLRPILRNCNMRIYIIKIFYVGTKSLILQYSVGFIQCISENKQQIWRTEMSPRLRNDVSKWRLLSFFPGSKESYSVSRARARKFQSLGAEKENSKRWESYEMGGGEPGAPTAPKCRAAMADLGPQIF